MNAVTLAKRWLPKDVKECLRPYLWRVIPSFVRPRAKDILVHRYSRTPNVFFVQIGSNDGELDDPLHRLITKNTSWRGIFVEPVKPVFDRLKANYGNDQRFVFLNVAVGDHAGKLPFFYLAETAKAELPNLPLAYYGLGSFNRQHIVRHVGEEVARFIVSEDVETVELSEVLAGVPKLDIFLIDTEGHDYRILRQLPFASLAPELIVFEHVHLAEDERQAARDLLRRERYEIEELGMDTVATSAAAKRETVWW